MSRNRWLPVLPALCAALLLGGCAERDDEPATAEDVEQQARELAETLESYSAEQRDQAVEAAQEAAAELNERVARLRARVAERWRDMDETARLNAEEHLERLRDEQADLAERLSALRGASDDAWDRVVRDGVTEAYGELRDAWRDTEEAVSD